MTLLTGFFTVSIVTFVFFLFAVYVAYPFFMRDRGELKYPLKIWQGLSSWWLVWPGFYALISGVVYLGERLTVFEIICMSFCLVMGLREGGRIAKVSQASWAQSAGVRVETDSSVSGV